MNKQIISLFFLIIIVFYFRQQINELTLSTIILILLGLTLLSKIIMNKQIENMSILSNEAIQNISSVFDDGTVTVNKQYCINNNGVVKCINWDFFNKNGTAKK